MSKENSEGEGEEVKLHVYDLSVGLAQAISPLLLGKQVGGIWHTGVVIYGQEYYFGHGINVAPAGQTPFQEPHQVLKLGRTHVPEELVEEVLLDLSATFTPESYSLLHHNCNNFSNEFCTFLLGKGIPEHIVKLPHEVLNSPFGQLLSPILNQLEQQLGSMGSGSSTNTFHTDSASSPRTSGPGHGHGTSGEDKRQAAQGSGSESQSEGKDEKKENSSESPSASREEDSERKSNEEPRLSAKEEFQKQVQVEFKKIMAAGAHTAQEAAVLALSLVREYMEGK